MVINLAVPLSVHLRKQVNKMESYSTDF